MCCFSSSAEGATVEMLTINSLDAAKKSGLPGEGAVFSTRRGLEDVKLQTDEILVANESQGPVCRIYTRLSRG